MIYRYFEPDPELPSGWRFVVLYHTGRKWMRFVDVSTLRKSERSVSELPKLKPFDYSPRKLAAQMSKRRALYKRLEVPFSIRAVQRAIAALKGAGS